LINPRITVMAKRTPTPAPAPASPAEAPGVIAALADLLRNGGGTVEELYAKLAERFPDRASAKGGMRATVVIQVEGRGTVYRAD
jgi:hypothetical protein